MNTDIYNLLIIDDEIEITKSLFRQFRKEYNVFTASSAQDAMSVMENNNIQLVISDQRMPVMTGLDFFITIKEKYPDAIKIMLSGYSDIEAVIGAINEGQIYRYITKPWNPEELSKLLKDATQKYELITKNKRLLYSLEERKQAEIKLKAANTELFFQNGEKEKRADELRKEKEKAEESEERLRIYINSTSDIVFTLDLEQRHTGVFGDWYKKSGMVASDLLGRTGKEILGEGSKIHEEANEKVLKGEPLVYEWSAKIHEKAVYYQTSLSPLKNENNEIVGIIGIGRDITQRKETELALKESEEKYRFLFENTTLGIVYQNATGKIIHANKAAERILGISLNQMQGLKSIDSRWKSTHEDGRDYPGEEHPAMITLKTGQAIHNAKMCVFNPLNNSHTILNISSFPKFKNNEVEPYQVVTTFEDITDQKKAGQALTESEELFRQLFENMSSGVAIFESVDNGADFCFKNFNSAAAKIDNLTKEKVIGNTISKVFPGAKELGFLEVFKRVWETGISEHFPISFYQDKRK